jgi:hypothetical protein
MHLNICGFTMSTWRLSLITKETLANGWTMVRPLQCSLNFYKYKLHNLYYWCHITKCQITNHHVLKIWIATNNILCCQFIEIGVNLAHIFSNINTMQRPFISLFHCIMETLHLTLQNHKQQRGNTWTIILIWYLTPIVTMALTQKKG